MGDPSCRDYENDDGDDNENDDGDDDDDDDDVMMYTSWWSVWKISTFLIGASVRLSCTLLSSECQIHVGRRWEKKQMYSPEVY